jgi:hypothetical protein
MKNIFKKSIIPSNYFNNCFSINIAHDLFDYLFNNSEGENYQTFRWNLQEALKNNANG